MKNSGIFSTENDTQKNRIRSRAVQGLEQIMVGMRGGIMPTDAEEQ